MIPDNPALLPEYLRQQESRSKAAAEADRPFLQLEVLYAAPSKVQAGMLVYADGVTWNPGAGEGVYRRNKGNTAWVLVG